MIELLCIITNEKDDKQVKEIQKNNNLPLNLATRGFGTASSSILNYFGLEEITKYIYFQIINKENKRKILKEITDKLNIKEHGNGIAFTIPISSATKYIKNKLDESKENNMEKEITEKIENRKEYELIITIVNEGYSEKVMTSAKNVGANGGTLIRGRSLLGKDPKKQFLGISIEPEKDIVLIVTKKEKKEKIMTNIIEKVGLKTKGNGIIFSLPISEAIGLFE